MQQLIWEMIPGNSDRGMGNATRGGRKVVIKIVAALGGWSSMLLGSSGIQCSVKHVSEVCQQKAKKLRWREWFPETCPVRPAEGAPAAKGKLQTERSRCLQQLFMDRQTWPDVRPP